jgi:hypothetical protein
MTIAAPGRRERTTRGLSEVTVARVAGAVHVAMVCFVLVAVVARRAGEAFSPAAQLTAVGGLVCVAVVVASRPGRGDRL